MLIDKENIFFDLESMTKEEAIKFAGSALVKKGYVTESYVPTMLEREESVSTYMGNGIAIPHGTESAKREVIKSGIVILHFREGILYDNETAFLVIGIAGKDNEHLELLSSIAIKFSDEKEVQKLVLAESVEKFYQHINEIDH